MPFFVTLRGLFWCLTESVEVRNSLSLSGIAMEPCQASVSAQSLSFPPDHRAGRHLWDIWKLHLPLSCLCKEEFLRNPIYGMTTEAVMGSVQNKKHNLVHVPEAVDQSIQKHLMSADDASGRRPACLPLSHRCQIAFCFEMTDDDLKECLLRDPASIRYLLGFE